MTGRLRSRLGLVGPDGGQLLRPVALAVVGALLAFSSPAVAAVRFVDVNATVSLNDGSSWCDAFLTLQDALSVAVATDEIRVADGTYTPTEQTCDVDNDCGGVSDTCVGGPGGLCNWATPRAQTFQLINGVTINGGYAGCGAPDPDARDVDANETILSGDISQNDTAVACTVDSPDCDSNGGLCLDGTCIIANNNGENSYHVVAGELTDSTALIDGFAITAGNADAGAFPDERGAGMFNNSGSPTVTNCTFSGNSAAVEGSGMDNFFASPTITNCTFSGNSASFGGGMSNNGGSPMVTDCTFSDNSVGASGGGMENVNVGSPKVTNCTFSGNSAGFRGGGMHNGSNSTPAVKNCTFSGNSAVGSGGGMFNENNTSPTVADCTFSENSAVEDGGGMGNLDSSPTVTNCTFSGNSAAFLGGGMKNDNSSPSVTNCTFSGNSAVFDGGGMANNNSSNPTVTNCSFSENSARDLGGGISNLSAGVNSPVLTNCILWGNIDDADASSGGPFTDESAQIHTDSGTPTVDHSIVQGGWTGAGGIGNSSSDPLFVDADGVDNVAGTDDDDLRIRIGSPAIDAGNNGAVPADSADLDGDLNTTEPTPFDLDGNDRFVDDPATADCSLALGACGTPPVVDMGAYELAPPVFVDDSAVGLADGTSWTDAYSTLQDALADARIIVGSEDAIWVAAGTYYPDEGGPAAGDDRSETFQLVNGVTIYGGFAGTESYLGDRDVVANETILSGDITQNDAPVGCGADSPDCDSNGGKCLASGFCIQNNSIGENSYHIVTGSGTDATAAIDGFTISGGNADGSFPDSDGAGMFNQNGSPQIIDCRFESNSADAAAAILNIGSGSLTVTGCSFAGNLADLAAGGGGGAIITDADITITNCSFTENHTGWDAGALWIVPPSAATITGTVFDSNSTDFSGGAIQISADGTTITDCTFRDNVAAATGGAIRIVDAVSNTTIRESTFVGNMAGDTGGAIFEFEISNTRIINSRFFGNSATNAGGDGGALGVVNSDPQVVNCIFSGNSTGPPGGGTAGGAVFTAGTSAPTFANCTFVGNISTQGSGGALFTRDTSTTTLDNCIIWDNGAIELTQFAPGTFAVSYSIVEGGWAGTAVLDVDPVFVDADGTDNIAGTEDDNLRIKPGSPARDAGDSTAVPADSADLDGDLDTAERTPVDLDGNNRFVDDLATVDTGVAASPVVDMGAFEGPSALRFVDVDATGADDGSSWTDAYPNLQDALADAGAAGGTVGEIWVAEGTYKPDIGASQTPGLRTETFQLINGLALYGGFAGTETTLNQRNVDANETVLSGDLTGDDPLVDSDCCLAHAPPGCDDAACESAVCGVDAFCCSLDWDASCATIAETQCPALCGGDNSENSYHVVTGSGTNASAILDGFTITAGNADGTFPDNGGAGMYNDTGSPMVTNCTFTRNSGGFGGGMFNNTASNATVTNCTFIYNSGGSAGGGMNNSSGSSPTVINCSFTANSAPFGGGMHNQSNSSPTVTNCMFSGNAAGSFFGGGMYNHDNCNPSVTNCTFSGNSAVGFGGGMFNGDSSSPMLTNCTFSGNSTDATEGGGIFNSGVNSPTLTNCILWGNIADFDASSGGPFTGESAQIDTDIGTPTVDYTIVQGGWSGAGGTGIVNADPIFVDADGPDNVLGTEDDNLRISACSPAIDAGDNDAVPADTLDLDEDMDTSEPLPFDLFGRERFKNDPLTADTGNPGTPGPPVVDMGAFEFAPPFFVDADAAGGAEDGSSWADAFANLQDALTHVDVLSGEVTEVWVAAGTYMPDGGYKPVGGAHVPGAGSDTVIGFQLRSGLGLYGGFDGSELCRDPRDREANETILSGDLLDNDSLVACTDDSDCGSNGGRCYQGFGAALDGFCIIKDNNSENNNNVVWVNGSDSSGILDGFTITGGNADLVGLTFGGGILAGFPGDGGGITKAAISNCVITGNVATSSGGGMFNSGFVPTQNSPTVRDCEFRGNAAVGASGQGGGLNYNRGSGVVEGCTFSANAAVDGGSINVGGGLAIGANAVSVSNCVFNGNKSEGSGGGLSTGGAGSVTNCIFTGNTADLGGGANLGSVTVAATFTNCTFSGNDAATDGGGIHHGNAGASTYANCVFWNNSDSGGMDESAQIFVAGGGTVTVNYSIVQGGWTGLGGTGIHTSDPTFVTNPSDGGDGWGVGGNDDFGDLHLQSLSPAVDAGDNDAVPADATDLDGDGNTTETLPVDLDDGPRILEDLLVADVGNAGALGTPIVDLGAYEFLRDCDGNGIPDDQDMTNCAGTPNCADCNGNDVPDGCDIAECDITVDLSCNDCDLNGVPDGCDDPIDNIPDDCVEAVSSGDWSADIWGLAGNFPDNGAGEPDQNVTLDAVDILLDVDAEIPTLRILNGATLDGSSSALTVVGNTGALVRVPGDPTETIIGPGSSLTAGELTATTILVFGGDPDKGRLLAKSDCEPPAVCLITADSLAVEGGGIYQQVGTGSTMQLIAGSITLSGGSCGANPGGVIEPNDIVSGGEINLFDGMTITTVKDETTGKTGDFIIIGTETADCSGALRGIIPPPKLGTGCSARRDLRALPGLVIGGNFIVTGMARISISATPCGLSRSLLPDQIVQLQGDFINQSTAPDLFDWETGGITLNGVSPQRFEVGGEDIGATAAGFTIPVGEFQTHSNFSMGTVEVAAGANVTFVDNFDNDGKPQGLEALYVHDLVLGAGATITVDNAKVYYGTLDDQGASINFLRSGILAKQSALVSTPLTAPFPHDRRKNRYISFDPNKIEHDGKMVAFKVELAAIAQGSCNGAAGDPPQVDFCRTDRVGDDCNTCAGAAAENSCINQPIDCGTNGTCTSTGETCVNDAPNSGGSNVGRVWWVGPESPLGSGVHLLVSESFRRVSVDWPNPVHVGDCEIVPEAAYGVRAVGATPDASGTENQSDELPVETTLFAPSSASWWGDCVGPLKKFCGGDIRTAECTSDGDCTAPETCDRAWTLPDNSVNFDDVNAALALVAPGPTSVAPDVTWVDLHGNASGTPGSQNFDPPNFVLNFSDIGQILSGFGGFPYKGYDPADCP